MRLLCEERVRGVLRVGRTGELFEWAESPAQPLGPLRPDLTIIAQSLSPGDITAAHARRRHPRAKAYSGLRPGSGSAPFRIVCFCVRQAVRRAAAGVGRETHPPYVARAGVARGR